MTYLRGCSEWSVDPIPYFVELAYRYWLASVYIENTFLIIWIINSIELLGEIS